MALDPLTAGIDFAGKLIDKIFPDPAQRDAAKVELLKLQQTGELAALQADADTAKSQLEVDKTEAASANLFVSGWRPFIGWVCGASFAYHFIFQPLISFLLAVAGRSFVLPLFDMNTLSTVLMGMLGLGSLRSLEKIRGVSK